MNIVLGHPTVKPPIRAWRIVGGAFLHFAVPVYVVTVALLTLFTARADAAIGTLARAALGYSGWFLAGYAMLAAGATLAAAAIEPLLGTRRIRSDDGRAAIESRLRVTQALAEARRLPGADIARLIDSIGGQRWDHDDSRFQALSGDLCQVVVTMTAANASASDKSRPEIVELATTSLQRIDQVLRTLGDERGRLDHGDAHAVARYVENRYGPSDFAGS